MSQLISELSGKWFTIMVDETTDKSNTEQMVVCLRYVDDSIEVHEEFLGLHNLESTTAHTIFITIKDISLRMGAGI